MSKKSYELKRRLGRAGKKSRKLPVLAQVRTHRRVQQNKFARSWRRTKMRIKVE
jgi:ribosomal protein L39E